MNEMDNRVTLSPTARQILEKLETVDQITQTVKADINEGLNAIDKVMATSEEVAP